jgi:hypothetical protein
MVSPYHLSVFFHLLPCDFSLFMNMHMKSDMSFRSIFRPRTSFFFFFFILTNKRNHRDILIVFSYWYFHNVEFYSLLRNYRWTGAAHSPSRRQLWQNEKREKNDGKCLYGESLLVTTSIIIEHLHSMYNRKFIWCNNLFRLFDLFLYITVYIYNRGLIIQYLIIPIIQI